MVIEAESLFDFLDAYLEIEDFPDYPAAHNGLQVQGPSRIERMSVAVDASEETINAAVDYGADLLLVHHGLFWGGGIPVTGRAFRRLSALLRNEVALYSAHLPLDAHPDVGNCAVLARELGFEPEARFGSFDGRDIGYEVTADEDREELRERCARLLGGPVQLLPGGPERIRRVGIVTGGGSSFLSAAAATGLDTLLTGEASHHTYVDAMELGVNVLLGGHYRTETWGVRALAGKLADRFSLEWDFLEFPSGL